VYNPGMSHTRASHANRRDQNEPPIIELLRRLGCVVIQMQPGQGFDLLVIAWNGVHLVEVKNPAYAFELTHDEALLKIRVEAIGGEYHVIQTPEDAARLVGR
jgi:hypothetical protein